MTQYTMPSKGSLAKRLPNKEFKLPIEQAMKIVDEVRKMEKHSKTIRPDESRKEYQQLLQWVSTSLQSTKQTVHESHSLSLHQISPQPLQQQTLQQQVQSQQRGIIQTLMMHMIDLFKRQCKQKSQLMQMCFEYFNQLINQYARYYEKELHETLKTYNITLDQLEEEYQGKLEECNRKITSLEGEKETKWKNIYMLAKDNRILRRQKGKLMRTIQQQDEKMKLLEQELCQVAKENQVNKLIIRFENDSENIKVFMKNRLALIKFQKIIEKYPKKAMKVLTNDLLKLEIEQLNSLDSKIDYIKRVIMQSGDIFDEYEDLNDLMTKPNKMVFNMYTQTDIEDIQPAKEYKEVGTSYELQQMADRFAFKEKLYDVKIVGFPELKEKYVCFRSPNRKLTNKPQIAKKKPDNDKKDFFVMQICTREVFYNINIKHKKRSEEFSISTNTGVVFSPKLKNKTKLFFVTSSDCLTKMNENEDQADMIFRQTMPANISMKKLVKDGNRKSQTLNQGKYAFNRMSIVKSSSKKRNSEALNIDNNEMSQTFDLNRDNQTIDEKSQIQSSIVSQDQYELDELNDTVNEDHSNFLPRFKKSKRTIRRTTELLSPLGKERNSTAGKISIFKQENMNKSTQRVSVNIYAKSQTLQKSNKKQQRVSTQGSEKRKCKEKNGSRMSKMGRIKTSENERNSNSSSKHKAQMDFIYEESEQQNHDSQQFNWQKMKKSNRLSYKQPVNTFKGSKFNDTFGNFSKENYMSEIQGILAQRNQKYHMTMTPNNFNNAARKIAKMARNSSFAMTKFKPRQSINNNMDTCSMNSHTPSQNESTFNPRTYLTQSIPITKQPAQLLQSEVMNPLMIKPYEIKKLTQKIVKNIYSRRKELLSSSTSTSLKGFIEHFLKQMYGNNWKGEKNVLRYAFTVSDREASSTIKAFCLMLNANVQIEYLEDLFRLYVTMLEKNQFTNSQNSLVTSKAKGAGILKYLLSIYFDQTTANDIQQNLPFMNQYEIDMNEIFVVVETQIRKYTIDTEIYNFLLRLLPENQSNIEFNQFKELLYLFKNEQKYHTHIARLKYFFRTFGRIVAQQQAIASKLQTGKTGRTSNTAVDNKSTNPLNKSQPKESTKEQASKGDIEILPIHRISLYLKRYQWTDMLEINTFVQEKYHKTVGVFIQEESIKFITKYCALLSERTSNKKKPMHYNNQNTNGMISISATIQPSPTATTSPIAIHPLTWLLQRTKELIRNYYRYKGPLDRFLLMFVHLSILAYEIQVGVNAVLCEPLGLLSLEYKKLKTMGEVDTFMKD